MKLQTVVLFTLVALVALVVGRAQNDAESDPADIQADIQTDDANANVNFFPAPNATEAGTEESTSGVVESVVEHGDEVGSVETFGFGFFPSLFHKPDININIDAWKCLCGDSISFDWVHGGVCKCGSPLRSICDAKFKIIKSKCFHKSTLSCRSQHMNNECSQAIRFYFQSSCCVDSVDDLLVQSRAALRWYGCGHCKDTAYCGH